APLRSETKRFAVSVYPLLVAAPATVEPARVSYPKSEEKVLYACSWAKAGAPTDAAAMMGSHLMRHLRCSPAREKPPYHQRAPDARSGEGTQRDAENTQRPPGGKSASSF